MLESAVLAISVAGLCSFIFCEEFTDFCRNSHGGHKDTKPGGVYGTGTREGKSPGGANFERKPGWGRCSRRYRGQVLLSTGAMQQVKPRYFPRPPPLLPPNSVRYNLAGKTLWGWAHIHVVGGLAAVQGGGKGCQGVQQSAGETDG